MSPMPPEDLAAIANVVDGAVKRHSSGERRRAESNGSGDGSVEGEAGSAEKAKKPWWKANIPTFVTAGLLGSVLGLGVAWGGFQALVGKQGEKIDKAEAALAGKADKTTAADLEKAAAELEKRVRDQEIANAALTAGNTAQHAAMTEKVVELKGDVGTVKADIADVKVDTGSVKRQMGDFSAKLDRVLLKLSK